MRKNKNDKKKYRQLSSFDDHRINQNELETMAA